LPPDWSNCLNVDDDEWLIILLKNKYHVVLSSEPGSRLQVSVLESDPDDPPSVWVESQTHGGIASLESAKPKWKEYGFARFKAGDMKNRFGYEAKYTPTMCDLPGFEKAHASLIGIMRGVVRLEAVRYLDTHCVVRLPTPESGKA
jgi:hypothetical protein